MNPWLTPPSGPMAAQAQAVAAVLPRIETARLVLRAPRIEDYAAWAAIACTERGVHIGGPYDPEEAWLDFCQMVAGWLLRGAGLWSVERRDTGALIGFVPLNHEWGDPEMELGFLFLPDGEGHGYAAEAATAARDHAFGSLGMTTLVSYIDPANGRALALAGRLGGHRDTAAEAAFADDPIAIHRFRTDAIPTLYRRDTEKVSQHLQQPGKGHD
jgi:RimJ/RimL family protein N-acetyltransferase